MEKKTGVIPRKRARYATFLDENGHTVIQRWDIVQNRYITTDEYTYGETRAIVRALNKLEDGGGWD